MRRFTSDTHFGHENIIKFCNRPHRNVGHMNSDMLSRITQALTPEDELWILGDAALGSLDNSLAFVAGIGVPVTLVAGNHDRCHPYYGNKSVGFEQLYLTSANLVALHTTNTTATLSSGLEVNVSHFPYGVTPQEARASKTRPGAVDKFAKWRPVDDGKWLLCGHVHDSWRQRGRIINVGIDAWGGQVVSEDQILELIDAGPKDLDIIPWV